jgi:large subunit ribosomal protein L10
MATVEKEAKVEELKAIMAEAKGFYLADFTGIDVAAVTELRNKLRDADVQYQVIKNRLAIRAAEEVGIAGLKEYFTGPTAIAYSKEDPIAPAKILQDFVDDGGKIQIKTGFMEGEVIAADRVEALAKLPSKEELLGKVVASVQSPLYGLSGVLNGLLRGLAGALSAIEKQRVEGGENA